MAGLTDVLSWLRGPQPAPSLGMEKAPPLAAYPTQQDADYARNYGFADSGINEDYLNNNRARVLGVPLNMKEPAKGGKASVSREMFIPLSGVGNDSKTVLSDKSSSDVNLNKDPQLQGDLRNVMMQAALAANRSPIAAMGFDPSRTVIDTVIKNPAIAGWYRPDADRMYATTDDPSAVVHESTHRGFKMLRDKYPEQVDNIMRKMPDEEVVVRWLMNSKGGDPEHGTGNISDKQRQQGINAFDNKNWPAASTQNQEYLRQLEELAIQDRLTRSRRSGPQ